MRNWKVKIVLKVLVLHVLVFHQLAAAETNELLVWLRTQVGHAEAAQFIPDFRSMVLARTGIDGRITPQLQLQLNEVERELITSFDGELLNNFDAIWAEIGAKLAYRPTQISKNSISFWHQNIEKDPLTHFRSAPTLPAYADFVIIGAGLTGASAAYHLLPALKSGKSVVILDAGAPASQASGKNGGNFQLLPEIYRGNYEGLVQERYKSLNSRYPEIHVKHLWKTAENQARVLFRFSQDNLQIFNDMVTQEKIDCDFSAGGWLRIPGSFDEERAILSELPWLRLLGAPAEAWTPDEIGSRFGITSAYSARFIGGSGNYHPQKFVYGVLKNVIAAGAQLYTNVKVEKLNAPQGSEGGPVTLEYPGGVLSAGKVIVATNAFTPELFPELKEITTVPSQQNSFEHVKNQLGGATVTALNGDIYCNFPGQNSKNGRGTLIFGLDFDLSVENPWNISVSEELYRKSKKRSDELFPETRGQPPSATWVGPMAFTPDGTPVIGFMNPQVVLAVAFQGYGGSFCMKAGSVAAHMAMTGNQSSDAPECIFGPRRLIKKLSSEEVITCAASL